MGKPAYEYHHIVGFEETNVVGNVYYVNHLRWQGRCREMFLRDKVPEVLSQIENGLSLVTTRCSCEYLAELFPFDHIIVRMRLSAIRQNRVSVVFEYWRKSADNEDLVARGEQEIATMQREGQRLIPIPIPHALREALQSYLEG